ncbi:asparagine synthase-related protein [Bacillus suaedae]|uniref:asparagine synthase (glutamine-hydrolyzing) n=1 Tax=Halalkalibacter suaedae TaxID=2822140 RepID=A0A941AND6_9BACI|nr:asparagine synthase-related protein [Bacillus suaedae]MBP3951505.1 asparagine synthetase B [Bacillus suaedae]
MSAIVGIYHSNRSSVPVDHLTKMMNSLAQFPANDLKSWNNNNIFLGCLSQWITPESIEEPLPFFDHERETAITADAIIDNRQELYDLLGIDRGLGATMPDSQLILLSYYKWGDESPKHLIGDFAFMIWDKRKNKLFGARDFSGGRTLYYFKNQQQFAFSTTIEALLSLPYVKRRLNETWLAEYLAISSVVDSVDTSITPYMYINQVPPSHSITVIGETIKLTQYCMLTDDKQLILHSDDEYVEAFQEVFQKAVDSRLRTHHNVGADLSGGLDSSSVVSFAAKTLKDQNRKLQTYSYIPTKEFIDFTPKQLMPDERPYIQSTVNYIGGIHAQYLDFEGKDSYSEIDEFLNILEGPYKFFENSFWLKGIFEKANEQNVGVLLNGGRGNFTISWGHALNYYAELLKKMRWIHLVRELNQYSKNAGGARLRRLPMLTNLAFPFTKKLYSSTVTYPFPTLINAQFALKHDVYSKLKQYGLNNTGWFSSDNIYELRRRHFEDIFHWNSTNSFAAKLSLRYGLWKRDSTNDLRVIKFCLSVPEEQCVRNGMDRALIRRATKGYLPDKVRLNQRIRGVQGADWVERMKPHWKAFIDEAERMTKDSGVMDFLDEAVIYHALSKAKDGPLSDHATDPDYRVLMRSVIVSRFIHQF